MGFTFLDMFCGAGGSSWGAKAAGGRLVGAIDAWSLAVDTIRENHSDAVVLNRRLGPTSRPSSKFPTTVDLLLASPECTNHSNAKGAAPRCEDSRNTARYVLNYARDLVPRWIVMENVIQMRGWQGYVPLIAALRRLGYNVRPQVLDAMDFGVAQTRRRLFLMCDREAEPQAVATTTAKARKKAGDIIRLDGPWLSTPLDNGRRAESTLARAQRAVVELGRGVPFLIVYYGSDGSGGWQRLDRPLRTLTTLDRFGLVTWAGDVPQLRMLQVDELKAAMGFPPSYKLSHGSRRDRIRMMGNGVCPPVMEAVVRTLTGEAVPAGVRSDQDRTAATSSSTVPEQLRLLLPPSEDRAPATGMNATDADLMPSRVAGSVRARA